VSTAAVIAASLCGAGALGACFLAPQAARPGAVRALRERCRARRAVCLTFDDGPGPLLTPRVVDALRSAEAKATFYMLGFRAQAAPEAVDMLAIAGHELGTHTMHHHHAWKCPPWTAARDVREGYEALARWVAPSGRFRPPYGKMSIGAWAALRGRGVRPDFWTIDAGDTWPTLPAPRRVADRIAREGGGVVLLHDFDRAVDAERRAAFVVAAVETIAHVARREGLTFMTMSLLEGSRQSTA
jgi:peptidoglycan/xylan/chitin deacetylase (PgdA/CDA1 family)